MSDKTTPPTLKVLNIHERTINAPKQKVAELLSTLSQPGDSIWPTEKWPAMKFKNGTKVGAKGGHGPIRYTVEKWDANEIIQFRFSSPSGFIGIHKLEIRELNSHQTEIKHTIDMLTIGTGALVWIIGVRVLHNALIEDAFDKLENS
jgi:hypothetical protein